VTSLSHLLLAKHGVCADSGHLVEGAPEAEPSTPDALTGAQREEEHCPVIDALQAPARLLSLSVSLSFVSPLLPPPGRARAGWTRRALVDAPKASPPVRAVAS
jgi:hypothetical protein